MELKSIGERSFHWSIFFDKHDCLIYDTDWHSIDGLSLEAPANRLESAGVCGWVPEL